MRKKTENIYNACIQNVCVCVYVRKTHFVSFAIVKSSYVHRRRWDVQIKILDSVRARGLLRATKQSAFFVAKTFFFFPFRIAILLSYLVTTTSVCICRAPKRIYIIIRTNTLALYVGTCVYYVKVYIYVYSDIQDTTHEENWMSSARVCWKINQLKR